jgi:hypothetical protein
VDCYPTAHPKGYREQHLPPVGSMMSPRSRSTPRLWGVARGVTVGLAAQIAPSVAIWQASLDHDTQPC